MIDYELVLGSINRTMRDYITEKLVMCDRLVIREQQSVREQLEYPFATYSITNPYLNVVSYVDDNKNMKESVEIVISYTFYSESSLQALTITQLALTCLNLRATRQKLWENNIAIVDKTGITNRDTFITIDVERRYGFDVRIRTQHNTYDDLRDIIDIESPEDAQLFN